jgi:hypothetical protein
MPKRRPLLLQLAPAVAQAPRLVDGPLFGAVPVAVP